MRRAAAQEKAFGQLAAQFADRMRTLPTILASHGLDRERRKLEARMSTYAASTMGVLKIAFLNAGIIDFFSSLSIAVLAVFLGLGHLKLLHIPGFSDLHLWQSLFILMHGAGVLRAVPPLCRAVSRQGRGATRQRRRSTDSSATSEPRAASRTCRFSTVSGRKPDSACRKRGWWRLSGQADRASRPCCDMLAGIEDAGRPRPTGKPWPGGVDWMPTDIAVLAGTLADAIVVEPPASAASRCCWRPLAVSACSTTALLPGGLDARIRPAATIFPAASGFASASPGRCCRNAPSWPTSRPPSSIAANADRVRPALVDCARDRLVVVATHDAELAKRAATVLNLDEQPRSHTGRPRNEPST